MTRNHNDEKFSKEYVPYSLHKNKLINLCKHIAQMNFHLLTQQKTRNLLDVTEDEWKQFQNSWDRLELDMFMKDGGTYRFRRHATFSAEPFAPPKLEAAQPHYQSLDYNTLNGGIARCFSHLEESTLNNEAFLATLSLCARIFGSLAPFYRWHIEAHQFRIYAQDDGASPTPEGIHQDGVCFVFMMLINRVNVLNGETRIYDLDKKILSSHTFTHPGEAAIVNDRHIMHGVTPILWVNPELPGHRDMLVITFRKN
ncbi:2OG-Fe dioxygenase family protein [Paenalcaligenes niemegkensis]|uniref:2OG-Fe dioxygenase family protein n=1 Tax=Paenalcaligenes niemegkensis TaxID=2895469 RepID=UPI001EE8D0FB|nr:2OG-Fe dioxygenase family protein [Paenalcaligenes niemegkensis]MCQ9615697.1 2OG-Fe dioxygenase family protein [Paenalcaligenes niemegkensis]